MNEFELRKRADMVARIGAAALAFGSWLPFDRPAPTRRTPPIRATGPGRSGGRHAQRSQAYDGPRDPYRQRPRITAARLRAWREHAGTKARPRND